MSQKLYRTTLIKYYTYIIVFSTALFTLILLQSLLITEQSNHSLLIPSTVGLPLPAQACSPAFLQSLHSDLQTFKPVWASKNSLPQAQTNPFSKI